MFLKAYLSKSKFSVVAGFLEDFNICPVSQVLAKLMNSKILVICGLKFDLKRLIQTRRRRQILTSLFIFDFEANDNVKAKLTQERSRHILFTLLVVNLADLVATQCEFYRRTNGQWASVGSVIH